MELQVKTRVFKLLFKEFSKKIECLHCIYNNILSHSMQEEMGKTQEFVTPFNYFEWKDEMVI